MPARRKDLNEATREDLAQIPQMSSARAETIIHYRDQHGGFNSIDQLSEVPGIGETMAQQVSEYFSVRGTRASGTREEGEDTEDENGEDGEEAEDGEAEVSEQQPAENEAGKERGRSASTSRSSSSSRSRR